MIHKDWKSILTKYNKNEIKSILSMNILKQISIPPSFFKYILLCKDADTYHCSLTKTLHIEKEGWDEIISSIPNITVITSPIVIEVYTDGAMGSYGIHIPNIVDIYGKLKDTGYAMTNNEIFSLPNVVYNATTQRGEYMAMCIALLIITKLNINKCKIITDSYNVFGLLTLWKSKNKHKNPDLIAIMKALYKKNKHEIVHTLSHGKDKTSIYNKGNDRADELAEMGRKCGNYDIHLIWNTDIKKMGHSVPLSMA